MFVDTKNHKNSKILSQHKEYRSIALENVQKQDCIDLFNNS